MVKSVKKKVPALPDVEFVRPYRAHRDYVFNKAFVVHRFCEFTLSMAAANDEFSPEEVFYGLIRFLGIQDEYKKAMNSYPPQFTKEVKREKPRKPK